MKEHRKKDRRMYVSTIRLIAVALTIGVFALTFSFVFGWGEWDKEKELQASTPVFRTLDTVTLEGEPFTVEDLKRSKLTAVNVWETTCPACLGEMPDLEKLSKEYPQEEFQLIGVCDDLYNRDGKINNTQVEKARSLMRDAGTTFPNLIPSQEMSGFNHVAIVAYPTTFFIDSEGNIIDKTAGSRDLEGWKEKVEEVIKKMDK